jgi:hypothetical protein
MAKRILLIICNMPNKFEVFNFVGDKNLSLDEFIEKMANSRKFTYEYIKDELSGYHPEANADGSKFENFLKNIEKP